MMYVLSFEFDSLFILSDLQVTSIESFDNVKSRLSELEVHCDEAIPKILVGNKDDNNQVNKVILTRHGQELAEYNNLLFFETSVKDNKNVTEIFNKLTKLVLQRRLEQSIMIQNNLLLEQNQFKKNAKNNRCCTA